MLHFDIGLHIIYRKHSDIDMYDVKSAITEEF